MKKILLGLSIIGAVAVANAQTTGAILDQQNSLANVNGMTQHFYVAPDSSLTLHFDLTNTTMNPVTYKMRKADVVMQSGSTAYFCLIPGLCYAPLSLVNSQPFTMPSSIEFSAYFISGPNVGDNEVHYVMYDVNNPSDSVTLDLIYHVSPLGLSNITTSNLISEPMPNPANSFVQFNYTMEAGSDNSLVIYNSLGEAVQTIALSNSTNSVRVETAELANGIYYCSFLSGNTTTAVRKLVVQH
jgi:hypothetical protein